MAAARPRRWLRSAGFATRRGGVAGASRRTGRSWRWRWLSVGVVVGYAIWIVLPSLFPVAYSIDLVNHYVLTDYLLRNNRLPPPVDARDYIHGMSMYPFAASLVAALAAWLTGALPITVLHPLCAVFLGVACLYSYALTSSLLEGYPLRRVISATAVLLLFWPAHYLVRYQFGWSDFFFSQVLGHVWLMSTLYWTHRLTRQVGSDCSPCRCC